MCPGNSRAIAGIHVVESVTTRAVRDSPDDLSALEERNMMAESSEVSTYYELLLEHAMRLSDYTGTVGALTKRKNDA